MPWESERLAPQFLVILDTCVTKRSRVRNVVLGTPPSLPEGYPEQSLPVIPNDTQGHLCKNYSALWATNRVDRKWGMTLQAQGKR